MYFEVVLAWDKSGLLICLDEPNIYLTKLEQPGKSEGELVDTLVGSLNTNSQGLF